MSRFSDAVQRVKTACKNSLKISNVYDCARPLLLFVGLFGMGATWICHGDGVYTLRNSRFSLLVFILVSLVFSPWLMAEQIIFLFAVHDPPPTFSVRIGFIMMFFKNVTLMSTVGIGCMMTHVYRKRFETIFQIINNIDSQLKEANIRVNHWKITVKIMVLTLITANSYEYLVYLLCFEIKKIILIMQLFFIHFLYMWTILFLLIIHERFVGLNELLEENATVTNSSIQIVGGGNPRDSYMLRRISLARHVHEQLTEVVQLFSDTCRYVILGLTTLTIIDMLVVLLCMLVEADLNLGDMHSLFSLTSRFVALIYICQASKSERRVLTARLRHLVAFETDREIIHQVQQYIMYNAYSAPALVDFLFADVDNGLLLMIIHVIISNALVIYSCTRQWLEYY